MSRTNVNITDSISIWRDKTNIISYAIGNLSLISDSDLVAAIVRLNNSDSDVNLSLDSISSLLNGSTILSNIDINGGTLDGVSIGDSVRGAAAFTDILIDTPLGIAYGGSGSDSAAGALTNFGLTATAAELNILDGVTAVAADINKTKTISASGSELINDASVSAMRDTLELGNLATTNIIDQDNMDSNRADRVPSQQSVKAYVDASTPSDATISQGYGGASRTEIGQITMFGRNASMGDTIDGASIGQVGSTTWECIGQSGHAQTYYSSEYTYYLTLWRRIS
jgi:hypothetical protein